MTDRTYDLDAWLETYKDAFTSFTRAQQDGFKALERFARFHYAVAGDVLGLRLRCHALCPSWFFSSPFHVQVCELTNMMNFDVLP